MPRLKTLAELYNNNFRDVVVVGDANSGYPTVMLSDMGNLFPFVCEPTCPAPVAKWSKDRFRLEGNLGSEHETASSKFTVSERSSATFSVSTLGADALTPEVIELDPSLPEKLNNDMEYWHALGIDVIKKLYALCVREPKMHPGFVKQAAQSKKEATQLLKMDKSLKGAKLKAEIDRLGAEIFVTKCAGRPAHDKPGASNKTKKKSSGGYIGFDVAAESSEVAQAAQSTAATEDDCDDPMHPDLGEKLEPGKRRAPITFYSKVYVPDPYDPNAKDRGPTHSSLPAAKCNADMPERIDAMRKINYFYMPLIFADGTKPKVGGRHPLMERDIVTVKGRKFPNPMWTPFEPGRQYLVTIPAQLRFTMMPGEGDFRLQVRTAMRQNQRVPIVIHLAVDGVEMPEERDFDLAKLKRKRDEADAKAVSDVGAQSPPDSKRTRSDNDDDDDGDDGDGEDSAQHAEANPFGDVGESNSPEITAAQEMDDADDF